jgi:hypothetical protein
MASPASNPEAITLAKHRTGDETRDEPGGMTILSHWRGCPLAGSSAASGSTSPPMADMKKAGIAAGLCASG